MKILLVQLPTSYLGAKERVYPLGLSRLSSLVPVEYDKSTLDMNLYPDPWPVLKEQLIDADADIVALSFRNLDPLAGHQASYLSSLKSAARMVRRYLPQSRLLAGGPAFSLFGKRLLTEIAEIDFGLVGEGEQSFPMLVNKDVAPAQIPGLVWRTGGQVLVNPAKEKMDMARIPTLDRQGFPVTDYQKKNAYIAAVGIEGKRGCDLACGYCVYPCLGGGMRLRPVKEIVDEMELLYNSDGVRLFHFTDSVVNRPQDHFEELCREIIRRKLTVSWTGFFREDGFTPKNLALAEKAGLVAIYFSADALNEYGLKTLNKRLGVNDIVSAAKLTAESGLLTMCHFLVNLPGEGQKEFDQSWRLLDELLGIHHQAKNLGAVILNHVRIYPGAPLTRRLLKSGWLDPRTDLLYPVYHNPQKTSHVLHEMEAHCHTAGINSRLELNLS